MKRKSSNKGMAGRQLQKFLIRLLLVMTISVVALAVILSVIIVNSSSNAIKESTANIFSVNSSQISGNIDSYIEKVESTVALIFSDEEYYLYDATDTTLTDYEKIQHQNAIVNRITDLAIMDTYADFGVIYSNDKTVGWISNTTKSTYTPNGLYDSLKAHITNEKTNDGWFLDESAERDRLYYVKQINANAVIVTSIYNAELGRVFEVPDELSTMNIRLIDEKQMILYSSDRTEIGKYVPEIFQGLVGDNMKLRAETSDYLVTVDTCSNNWRVLCTMDMDSALSEVEGLKKSALYLSCIIMGIFMIVVALAFKKLSNPVDGMFTALQNRAERDGLSGLLNKISFEQYFDSVRENMSDRDTVAFAIMDVDHFKAVNDTLGHAYGDQVIVRTAEIIERVLGETATVGRIGGDEFAILFDTPAIPEKSAKDEVINRIEKLSDEFLKEFEAERESCNISLSVGIYYGEIGDQIFQSVYRKADTALYKSKENGRNQYTVYEEEQ